MDAQTLVTEFKTHTPIVLPSGGDGQVIMEKVKTAADALVKTWGPQYLDTIGQDYRMKAVSLVAMADDGKEEFLATVMAKSGSAKCLSETHGIFSEKLLGELADKLQRESSSVH